jgi:hypothetical protein
VYSGFGYLSNLYDQLTSTSSASQLAGNRAWAHVQFSLRQFYLNDRTVFLQRATFLDEVEGVASAFYNNGQWNPRQCGLRAFAYFNGTGDACACVTGAFLNPTTGECLLGCPAGSFGPGCQVRSIPDVNCPYRTNPFTLFQQLDTCAPVCQQGYALGAVECKLALVAARELLPPVVNTLVDATSSSGASLSNTEVVIVTLSSLAGAASVAFASYQGYVAWSAARLLASKAIMTNPTMKGIGSISGKVSVR